MDAKKLILDIWNIRVDALDEIIRTDFKYHDLLKEQEEKWKAVEELGLSKEDQWKVIEYADTREAVGERYSKVAYSLGFEDGITLGKL